jgi:hypothetical protein
LQLDLLAKVFTGILMGLMWTQMHPYKYKGFPTSLYSISFMPVPGTTSIVHAFDALAEDTDYGLGGT